MKVHALRLCVVFMLTLPLFAADKKASAGQQTVTVWTADSIPWEPTNPDGTKDAILEGDPSLKGKPYTYAFFIPAGYYEHHWHTAAARVAVLRGAIRVALGDHLDKSNMQTFAAGTYFIVPANVEHSMGAETDTVIIGTAIGPWKTHHHGESGAMSASSHDKSHHQNAAAQK